MKKKTIYGTLILALLGAGIGGCKKVEFQNELKTANTFNLKNEINVFEYSALSSEEKIVEFDKIGQVHNEGLEFTFDYLVSRSDINTSIQEFNDLAQQAGMQFLIKLSLDSYYEDALNFNNEIFQTNDLSKFLQSKIEKMNLNSKQIEYMDSIEMEFINLSISQNDELFKKRLLELEYSAINELEDAQELPILSYLSVSRASVEYWLNNGDRWIDKVPHAVKPNYWGEVAKADGKGAAGGAGWFGGAAIFGGPVTWAAFGGCVAGGALSCSVYQMF